jgi:hypothetical protein
MEPSAATSGNSLDTPDITTSDDSTPGGQSNPTTNSATPVTPGATTTAMGGVEDERLRSADLTYRGAFRLPDEFNWGALGMSFYPEGDGGAGSLLVTGFQLPYDPAHPGESCYNAAWDCRAFYGEVNLPVPVRPANWEDLPQAKLMRGMTSFDGGLAATVHREYIYISDIEYVPRTGSQTSSKLYGSINLWYAEGVAGENTFPTIWLANLDGGNPRGMFHVGTQQTPFHGRKMGAYLFTVPPWYADRYLGGRMLVTGRCRGTPVDEAEPVTTRGGSQGPTLFAFRPADRDNPTGDLDALPMLYYRVAFPGCAGPNVGDKAACDYPDFTMCDDWTGAAFVDNGSRRAIVLLGYKGLGENCYDEPPVECHDPCSDFHGYHCQPYERQIIFYDVHELGHSARGEQDPWIVVPYAIWRPTEFYLVTNPCANAGGMTFDPRGRRLFVAERGLGGDTNAIAIHVWEL